MKYLLLLLQFVIFVTISSAHTPPKSNYLTYHTYINRAEACLVDNKIDSCLRYYDRAFKEFEFIFAKDAFIAAQVAAKSGDRLRAKNYLGKGARYGLTADCLDQSEILKELKTLYAYEAIADTMQKAYALYKSSRNDSLAGEWKSRFEKEQRTKNISFAQYKEVVLDNVERIKHLTKTVGFPAEKLLGLSGDCKELGNYHGFYSLAHYDYAATEFFDKLWASVKKGELHPRDFAALCEFEALRMYSVPPANKINSSTKKLKPKYLIFNHVWYRDTTRELVAQVTANRKKYYLVSEAIDRKKEMLEKTEGYRFTFNYK